MKKMIAIGALALTTTLTACGSGDDSPKLSTEQQDLVKTMHERGAGSEKDLTCLIGKLKDDNEALEGIRSDKNLSEQQNMAGGERVAGAWADCTGKTFEESFGYMP